MLFRQLFDRESSTYTYLLADEESHEAVLIDAVRDQSERDIALLTELGLTLLHTLETHVHADHISASSVLRDQLGSRSVMSARAGAGCADMLVNDGDKIQFGRYGLEARLTPGHTDGCVSFVDHAGGRVFTGDTLLIRGCGRTDFQQGDAATLYGSVHDKLFSLPAETAVYPGHDYQGRTSSNIGEEQRLNPRLGDGKSKEQFVEIMNELKLARPKKILEAVPANLSCGAVGDQATWAPIERVGGNVPEVRAQWVREHLGAFRVVDVREQDEFVGPLGHVENSELIPLGTVGASARSWSRDEKIVIVCRSGGRSGRAALELEAMDFTHVASMRGGMILWSEISQTVSSVTGACG